MTLHPFWTAVALALMPAAGNFAGGLLAEFMPVSRRTLSFALHGAAGIIIAVVGVELMPTAISARPAWVVIAAFIAGGLFFIGVDHMIEVVQSRIGNGAGDAGAWAIFFGVAMDLFSDGVMIGAGSTVSFSLGLLLAIGQVPADIPEGFATIANFKAAGVGRRARILLGLAFTIPILLGTVIGYFAVRGRPEIVKFSVLAFVAGVLITVAVEEMVPEAHREKDTRLATLCFIVGFSVFTALAVYLE